jgi:DNA invertase Pin-like site-specific DNA recombinase
MKEVTAGKRRGRKPVFNEQDIDVIRGKAIAGVPKIRIAKQYGVSKATIYKYLGDSKRLPR